MEIIKKKCHNMEKYGKNDKKMEKHLEKMAKYVKIRKIKSK